jgi:hypothetical protein
MRFFTPPGFGAAAGAAVILVRSLSARNAYEIALSAGVLGVGLILGIAGAWGAKRLASLKPGWKPPAPFFAGDSGETLVTGFGLPIPWFFRIHFIIKGRFFPAGDSQACRVLAETSVPRGSLTGSLALTFPMSGRFEGEGTCRLKDIFGLFSFPCGIPQHRGLMIRSAPGRKKTFRIRARSGAEDRRTKNASDEERYYMREYAPGDRFRDINWKSSERIDTLITRISPDNQEKVSRIEVYFRNFGPAGGKGKDRASLRDLWLLDRAKALLAQFLRSVKEEQGAYIFHIRTAQAETEVAEPAEIESFLEDLAALPFAPSRNEGSVPEPGDLYVFSTACDGGLPAFLTARQSLPTALFFTRSPLAETSAEEIDRLKTRDFWSSGFILPRRFLFLGKDRLQASPNLPGTKTEIQYAEVQV